MQEVFQMSDLHILNDFAFLISNSSIIKEEVILSKFTTH